ncbi:MAG: DNA topoisomerase III [Tissierellia bacterium]|nr:DNA topoisomerase III [Tissierellia bacterium]
MAKIVVLAEKPSVGREIARVLKANKSNNGFMEGDKYIVTWGLGHLVTLATPEQYKKEYSEWKMEHLPLIPDKTKLVVIPNTRKQFNTVKFLLNRKDVDEIIIATDAGREGELVARWIIEEAGTKKPMKRLWISSVTDKAIREGFNKLKSSKEYDNLYRSAKSRAEADWIVGINATRALTLKYNTPLSCGRVQTPTLAIVKEREDQIKSFRPKEYYEIEALANGVKFNYRDSNNSTRVFNRDVLDKVMSETKGKDLKVEKVDSSKKKSYPDRLYDLTTLQADANRMFGFSTKETLNIMQNLYERHKVLTYPRTDSRYLTDDIVATIPERLRAVSVGSYKEYAQELLKKKIVKNSNYVNSSKVSDHHAIIPTEEKPYLSDFTNGERKIYDLVVKRFLSVLMEPEEYLETVVEGKINGHRFNTKGKVVVNSGFKALYRDEEKESINTLPKLSVGEILSINRINFQKNYTTPPSYFTEGTLLKAMENPSKHIDSGDAEINKILTETGGIGTVATRADIMDKLFNSFLLEKKGESIYITSKGSQLLDLVPVEMKSPELTGEWEQKLIKIENGKLRADDFMKEIKDFSKENIATIKSEDKKFVHDNITNTECPECGKKMLEVNSKNRKMLVCQDRECGYRKTISTLSNARCPECKKKMELYGEGDKKTFFCACGYRESLDSFNKRKAKQKDTMSRGDARKYMKKQEDENLGNSLADQLKNLKLD